MHELLDNGHDWRMVKGIRNGKLEEKPVTEWPLPDKTWVHESWKTSAGYVSHALWIVRKGELKVMIPPTYKRDEPALSLAEWCKECAEKGVPDLAAQLSLLSLPEAAPAKAGCTCLQVLVRIPVRMEGDKLEVRNKRGTITRGQPKGWVAAFGEQIYADTKAKAIRWLAGHLLASAYPTLTWQNDQVVLKWERLDESQGEVKAGAIRMRVWLLQGVWQWQTDIGKQRLTGSAETARKAQKAAALALGAV